MKVRVYTPSEVCNELEMAKRDYLHASIGISQPSHSSSKLFVPKLLDWYMLDFAEDMESLVKWVCLQLSTTIGTDIAKRVDRAKKEMGVYACGEEVIKVMPYDFSFRYIFYK